MKRNILARFAVAAMTVALVCGINVRSSALTTSATNATSTDFDCVYGANDKTDPFISNGYGSTEVVAYTEAEATDAGVPAGFSGDVISVLHTTINRGIMLDFSSQNIPIDMVDSITFRVYVGDDGIPTDAYPELRIPQPKTDGGWVMRYSLVNKTDTWQEVVLKNGNGTFFNNANFNMLAKDGYLYKLELAMRHNGSNAAFYIDSVKVGLIVDETAPVLTYNGEDVVTVALGQQLNFDISAVDDLEGAVDVEYVWGDPSKIENGLPIVGTHTLTFIARDSVGNTSEKTITVIVEGLDVTPPTLIVPIDTVYAKVGARSLFTFTASDNESDVEITLTWSDGALDRYERLTEGVHTLTVTATDSSGNKTQEIITFIVTEEGDTADVIIDEEALCPDSAESDSSEDLPTSEEPVSSESSSVSEEPVSSESSSTSEEPDSSENSSASEEPVSSESSSASEEPVSSESSSMSEDIVSIEDSKVGETESNQHTDEDDESGCGSSLGAATGISLLVLGAGILLKKKED